AEDDASRPLQRHRRARTDAAYRVWHPLLVRVIVAGLREDQGRNVDPRGTSTRGASPLGSRAWCARTQRRVPQASAVNAVETHELTRTFDGRVAVEDLTLAIPAGTVLGFLGPNGAGKTTTVRMLTALIAATSGEATVAGHRIGADDMALRAAVG